MTENLFRLNTLIASFNEINVLNRRLCIFKVNNLKLLLLIILYFHRHQKTIHSDFFLAHFSTIRNAGEKCEIFTSPLHIALIYFRYAIFCSHQNAFVNNNNKYWVRERVMHTHTHNVK